MAVLMTHSGFTFIVFACTGKMFFQKGVGFDKVVRMTKSGPQVDIDRLEIGYGMARNGCPAFIDG